MAMNGKHNQTRTTKQLLATELLLLPDGRILVHNLTQPFAKLLRELNPHDEQISARVTTNTRQASPLSPSKKQMSDRCDACPAPL